MLKSPTCNFGCVRFLRARRLAVLVVGGRRLDVAEVSVIPFLVIAKLVALVELTQALEHDEVGEGTLVSIVTKSRRSTCLVSERLPTITLHIVNVALAVTFRQSMSAARLQMRLRSRNKTCNFTLNEPNSSSRSTFITQYSSIKPPMKARKVTCRSLFPPHRRSFRLDVAHEKSVI